MSKVYQHDMENDKCVPLCRLCRIDRLVEDIRDLNRLLTNHHIMESDHDRYAPTGACRLCTESGTRKRTSCM